MIILKRLFYLFQKTILFIGNGLSKCYEKQCVSRCVCMRMLYVCIRILEACIHIRVPRNPDLGFLLFRLFWLILITCLCPVESSFHVSRSSVSRITCFTCLIDILVIRVYALMNHMNIHENMNMHWYIGAKVVWCSKVSR